MDDQMRKRIISAIALTGVVGLAVGGIAVADHNNGDRGQKKLERAAMLDANENGLIERNEIESAKNAKFATIDTNGDGGLSMDELYAYREAKRVERRARRFARQDVNGDGLIGPEEFQSRRMSRFDRMDLDGDGQITAEHWASQRNGDRRHGRRHRHQRDQ